MQINNYNYVHKKIRALCFEFEQATNLKCVTNLDDEFFEIKFCSSLSYVTIDFLHNTYFVMCMKLDKKQFAIAEDIMTYVQWLLIGNQTTALIDPTHVKKC